MKTFLPIVFLGIFLAGCSYLDMGPVFSRSGVGILEVYARDKQGGAISNAEIYLDGIFVGSVTSPTILLDVNRGARVVRITAAGYKPYERTVTILGKPNRQILSAYLEKE